MPVPATHETELPSDPSPSHKNGKGAYHGKLPRSVWWMRSLSLCVWI